MRLWTLFKLLPIEDLLEIEINGKLIFSRANLGRDPDIEEIVEITKWGHRVSKYLTSLSCPHRWQACLGRRSKVIKNILSSVRSEGFIPVSSLYPDGVSVLSKLDVQGKSFLHMYLCSVAEGGEPRMVITDRRNTPLARRIVMSCTIQWTSTSRRNVLFRRLINAYMFCNGLNL